MFKIKELIDISRISSDEYLIKDQNGITIGRMEIINLNKEYKSAIIKFSYYRKNNQMLLKECVFVACARLFKAEELFKINVIINEDMDISVFTQLGFALEGILDNNISQNGMCKSEYLFGITSIQLNSRTFNSCLEIKGQKVDLKLLTPEYTKDVLDYYTRNRRYLEKFEPVRDTTFYTENVQKKILSENYRQYINGTSINLGVFKENRLIGKIQLSNIVYGIFKNAFIGYSIDEKEQGNGYMKDAVKTLLEYAFNDMELHRVEASTLTDNFKSQNVLKSCGFQELGLNKNYLNINGEWRDHISFYKTN